VIGSRATLLFPAAFFLASLLAAWAQGFYQHHNDFWDTYLAARRLAWQDPATWFNGQYPIANILSVRAFMAAGNPVPPAIILNILFAGLTVFLIGRLSRDLLPAAWGAFAVMVLAVFPEFFRYANAGGGDPAAALLFTAGTAVLLREILNEPDRDRTHMGRWILAGLLMGWAGLFRYHAFVGGALWAAAVFATLAGRRRAGLLLAIGLCAGFAPQWIVNLLAGRGLFETGFGPMNVYHLMHGMNWQRVTDLSVTGSAADIIAADPVLFLKRYLVSFWSFKHIWIPPLMALALAQAPVRTPAHRRAFLALALWSTAYFVLFSATSSGRQGLLVLPFSMLALGYSLHVLWIQTGSRVSVPRAILRTFLLAVCAALLALHVVRDGLWLRERGDMRAAAVAAEQTLIRAGASRAAAVFSTDYDLYFAGYPDLVPRTNGGAVRLGTDWYNAAFPELPADDLAAFAAASHAQGVSFLALDGAAGDLSEPMGRLYARGADTAGFRMLAETPRHRIYRVP
jgi:hypothetical protein